MDLIQISGSLIAIMVLALIAARLFPVKGGLTRERVLSNVTRFCPDIEFEVLAAKVFVSAKGDAAVLVFPSPSDGIAIATALGDRVVVRHINDLSKVAVSRTKNSLALDTHDFTQPTIAIDLPEDQLSDLTALLTAEQGCPGDPLHA